ncbi:proton-conducting transporter transmembrane domain-containing protein [Segeticoccus rhizosphaerae]|uniref:proton-conducting transporter transmembrane domain-containing protein n=1 Tax=Segeticoccus rhizosphaerae TaxID=1104777 RepID=UPI0010C07ACD|nr:proton-conducting transporter membrane subunit [Ornithinicoccus soli]
MTALVLVLVCLPLSGTVAALTGARARDCGYAAVAGAVGAFVLAVADLVRVTRSGSFTTVGGFVYVDELSAFFLFTVALVVLLSSLAAAAYLQVEEQRRALTPFQIRLFFVFFGLFATLMLASLSTGNLGMLFVLIEASTLSSAALVGLEAKSASLEAAWKYVIISSLGVTVALVGTLFIFYSATGLNLTSNLGLTWPYLYAHAAQLSHSSLRLGFLLAVVGYGTKVGLAPMHTWLPDAHSEAPSPASAMLSAALLNTGMYAIIRFLALARVGLGPTYPQNVMLVFGFLSVVIGVLFMVRRGNVKRLFAYSSVEHMGIIAIALGFGGTLGLYGALLHTLTHAVGKTVLFLTSGDVVLSQHTREAAQVRGLLTSQPVTGAVLLLGSLAILGSPPFGLFLSELTIVRAGFATGSWALPAALLVLLVIAFIAFARTTTGMALGEPTPATAPYQGATKVLAALPLLAGMTVLLLLGLWIPSGLDTAILTSIGAVT